MAPKISKRPAAPPSPAPREGTPPVRSDSRRVSFSDDVPEARAVSGSIPSADGDMCDKLTVLFHELIGIHGRNFIKYDEATKTKDTVVDQHLISAASEQLNKIRSLSETFTLKRSDVKTALRRAADLQDWKLSDERMQQWATVHEHRVMNICSVVAAASRRTSLPAWYVGMPWMHAGPTAPTTPTTTTEADGPKWFFGFDTWSKNAWRVPMNNRHAAKEPATGWKDLEIDPGSLDTTPAVAMFADGTEGEIPGVTARRAIELQEKTFRKQPGEEFFVAEHPVTHNKISVRRRGDRGILVAMYEQERMVCMVAAGLFGPEKDDPCFDKENIAATGSS